MNVLVYVIGDYLYDPHRQIDSAGNYLHANATEDDTVRSISNGPWVVSQATTERDAIERVAKAVNMQGGLRLAAVPCTVLALTVTAEEESIQ